MFIYTIVSALWSFVIPYNFVHDLKLFWEVVFNKFQTPVWGHTEIPGGRVPQAPKVGYKRYRIVHAWWGKADRLEIPADVQACWHDSTVHAWRFFPPKMQKQMTVTSLDDVTDGLLMYIGGRDKGSTHKTRGLCFGFGFSYFRLVPQLVHLGSHKPSNLDTSVLLRNGTITRQGSVLYLFTCMYSRLSWVSWVSVI